MLEKKTVTIQRSRPGCLAYGPESIASLRPGLPPGHKHVSLVGTSQFHPCAWLFVAFLLALITFAAQPLHASGLDPVQYLQPTNTPGSFPIVQGASAAALFVDPADWPGVRRAVADLQSDIARVTDHKPALLATPESLPKTAILIGTLGKSPLIDQLAKAGKIDTAKIAGKWESFLLQTVANPLPGVDSALVIAGSDKRGTIFALYDLSEQIGVSPWSWWSDVPVPHQDALFVKPGTYQQGEPSVKYRGIFINDESPDLTNWVREKYGDVPNVNGAANYNHEFYARIFELLLRLKGNYLWPAMWNNAFNEDDPENARLADEFGIVMGTSHQEPMLRAQKEWDRGPGRQNGNWNYNNVQQRPALENFWREGVRRNKSFESIFTLGLRAENDSGAPIGAALTEQIIAAQRKILSEEMNPDLAKVTQLWCPYKEVLDYYNAGLRAPDDVTLLWTDDNWGNIRRLPTLQERARPGGAGIYYHFDYVGGPRNYKWINTNPISKVWEQMTLAKNYGADRIWIVNVGHFKGLEFPIEFFLRHAWNTDQWTNQTLGDYTRFWAQREFGPAHAADIADIITQYTQSNGRRKPELLEPTTYSLVNYQEADTVVADFKALTAKAESIYAQLSANQRDSFYELVLFPAKACAQVNELYIAAGKNALYAQQGRAGANDMAAQVQTLFKADADLMDEYNHRLADGKWNHFMDQVHIGYTIWQDPQRNIIPRTVQIQLPAAAAMGIAVEGSASAWPGVTTDPILPTIDAFNRQRRFVDVFNRGQAPFDFTAAASDPWITLNESRGTIAKEKRLWVGVDLSKAPQGSATGSITLSQAGGGAPITIKLQSFNPAEITRDSLDGFVQSEGCVSIEAEHFTRNIPAGNTRWEKIDNAGRTLSAMTILPMTAPSVTPPAAAPCLEYKMYLFDAGSVNVLAVVAPSLNFAPDRGVRCAVSFDDQPPQIVTIVPQNFNAQNGNQNWEVSVRDNCRIVSSSHTLAAPGYHTLKFWMVDPAVVLQKIVVDLGGVKPCYLGPPESFRRAAPANP